MNKYESIYVIGIDQGTSSFRSWIFDCRNGHCVSNHSVDTKSLINDEGYIEHDPFDLWQNAQDCIETTINKFLSKPDCKIEQIKAMGISHPRETCLCWNKNTRKAYSNAIVYNDLRSQCYIDDLISKNGLFAVSDKTGLPQGTYFCASKIKWILDNSSMKDDINNGAVFGSIDTWLIWNLTNELKTDVTSAARTNLFNIKTLRWDDELCNYYGIPINILPIVQESFSTFGIINHGPLKGVPIKVVLGDQFASLYGQNCILPGNTKVTLGTGASLLCNIGKTFQYEKNGLMYTIVSQIEGNVQFGVEGVIPCAGASIKWLINNLNISQNETDIEQLINATNDINNVYFVSTFTGTYTPDWNTKMKACILGLSLNTTIGNIARSCLESIAFQIARFALLMEKSNIEINQLVIDGGMSSNNTLIQMIANLTKMDTVVAFNKEAGVYGVARLASRSFHITMPTVKKKSKVYHPNMNDDERIKKIKMWNKAFNTIKEFE
ncbi:hypothetical protein A3Q56_04633 [Intoshia linei]|uniref:Glycerol kinase n=1 Tax=Intoshia linei TaxID=1819745 RepID=A0A177B1U9_9BILA|nr:hypothetical protein A3Q56_04633 [Intoshia linei]